MSLDNADSDKSNLVRKFRELLDRRLTKGMFGQIGVMLEVKDGSPISCEVVDTQRFKPSELGAT